MTGGQLSNGDKSSFMDRQPVRSGPYATSAAPPQFASTLRLSLAPSAPRAVPQESFPRYSRRLKSCPWGSRTTCHALPLPRPLPIQRPCLLIVHSAPNTSLTSVLSIIVMCYPVTLQAGVSRLRLGAFAAQPPTGGWHLFSMAAPRAPSAIHVFCRAISYRLNDLQLWRVLLTSQFSSSYAPRRRSRGISAYCALLPSGFLRAGYECGAADATVASALLVSIHNGE